MNDRTKRESIVNFALKNGIKLPTDFRAGDGTYKNSEAAKELAGRIFATMDAAVEAYFATGDKGTAQKNLSALADMICQLDKNAQTKRFAVQGELDQLSAKMKRADASLSDKKTVLEFTAQTLELLDYYSKIGERGMNPTNSARLAAMLNNVIDTIENSVCDGYSNKANYSAIGVANVLINIRNDVSTGIVSSITLGEMEKELAKELALWCDLQNAPAAKDICPENYKVKLNHKDMFAALTQVPEIKEMADETFTAYVKADARNRSKEIAANMDLLHSKYVAYENEINSVMDLADNGRISDAEADAKIVELERKQAELQEQYNKLNSKKELMKPEVEANEKFYGCMDMIKSKYDFYCENAQYPIFVQLFSPSEFDYSGVIRMMTTNPSEDTMRKVKETVYTFAANLAKREAAIKQQNAMFEEIYARQRSGNRGSILDDIPATMNPTENADIRNHNSSGMGNNGGMPEQGSSLARRRAARAAQGQNQGNQEQQRTNTQEQKQDTQIFNGYSNDN